MKQNGTTNKQSRQKRALAQRREELLAWQEDPIEIASRGSVPPSKVDVDQKIAQCKREIAILEQRIGVVAQ